MLPLGEADVGHLSFKMILMKTTGVFSLLRHMDMVEEEVPMLGQVLLYELAVSSCCLITSECPIHLNSCHVMLIFPYL